MQRKRLRLGKEQTKEEAEAESWYGREFQQGPAGTFWDIDKMVFSWHMKPKDFVFDLHEHPHNQALLMTSDTLLVQDKGSQTKSSAGLPELSTWRLESKSVFHAVENKNFLMIRQWI